MAEEKKGVTVMVPKVWEREDYPEGQHINVADGHLHVAGPGGLGDVIAIYAPGKWTSAKVIR